MGWAGFLLELLVLFGHVALVIALVNRLHSFALPRLLIKLVSRVAYLWIILITLASARAWSEGQTSAVVYLPSDWRYTPLLYRGLYASFGIVTLLQWAKRRFLNRETAVRRQSHYDIDLAERFDRLPVEGIRGRVAACLPRNEIFRLRVLSKELVIPGLPAALDGLTISHLSDFHFVGDVQPSLFREMIDVANSLGSDLAVVTGDIFDKAKCFSWIPETLGRLSAPLGVYFILGNHDLRTRDVPGARRSLTDSGLIDVGGKCLTLNIRGVEVSIAGNELPWIQPAPPASSTTSSGSFRILLTHAPDQIRWAVRNGFHLVLAGHTHGGQIRFPLIGPTLCPSRYGVRYAGGTYRCGTTVMHVSRGMGGKTPVRLNCPPEVSQLTLRAE